MTFIDLVLMTSIQLHPTQLSKQLMIGSCYRDEKAPLAGIRGRRIVNSASSGRERITFKSSPDLANVRMKIKSAEERGIFINKKKTAREVPSVSTADTLEVEQSAEEEQYNGLQGQDLADFRTRPRVKRFSQASLASKTASMCLPDSDFKAALKRNLMV